MRRKDIIFSRIDNEYDLHIENGDFKIDESDLQHVLHILEANQGHYRQHPYVGVGIRKMLNGNITGNEKRDITIQLNNDGYQPIEVRYDAGNLNIRLQ